MKKAIPIIGGIILVIGVLIGFVDKTLGFWQIKSVYELLGSTTTNISFLSIFGQISKTGSNDVSSVADITPFLIVAISILIGGILIIFGGVKNTKGLTIIASIIAIAGLAYFVYSLANIPEVGDLMILISNDKSRIFGTETISLIGTTTYHWRLGNGYLISAAGALISLIGSFTKD
ncbi:MAG: hypothetical protein ACTSVU_04575 [Promethearchaeota archaeon]